MFASLSLVNLDYAHLCVIDLKEGGLGCSEHKQLKYVERMKGISVYVYSMTLNVMEKGQGHGRYKKQRATRIFLIRKERPGISL
ncbi:hypothetical protein [Bacillus wiedmannii]|uniref:hypothetical protein n=1 Tax=Bacillus wiedmannii TaxID=1890302 RepID=UPI00065B9310|nr:hypothetical protein [Bacillus wiedmannii]KMP71913.1 hypothetical protein TU62_27030 [Bacillus cereus]MBG9858721.1 hypothetical protein [Bacillus wiedmannii]MCQ6546873.1 hypothetical protein [Bacillus wiedmannii]MCQ6571135.1 hypothetical protein [Bacillus wiedmannii]MCU5577817.1 hypothetical protein [Bacillus wiedmannii]